MRNLFLIAVLALPSALLAQSPSGRHFVRPSRQPVTPAAAPVVEASSGSTARVEPVRRLHSGRSWSAFHFSRRPLTPAPASSQPVDAAAKSPVRRTAMWGRVVRA